MRYPNEDPEDLQPGGRSPAPGELAVVQSFLNTHRDLRNNYTETFISGDALATWLVARGLLSLGCRLHEGDLHRALAVREGLRALAFRNNGHSIDESVIEAMHGASTDARTRIRIEPDGPRFLLDADGGLDGAIGAVYAIVGQAMMDGSWQRIKACPGRHCGWVFFDNSRNQSARWCSMNVCGDREKARTYYRRRTESQSAG